MPSEASTFTFVVETKGLRFDQFLALQFPAISLTRLRRAVQQGDARINGRNSFAGWILQPGDQITITVDPGSPTAATPENIPLDILFEDDDLIVVNKQVGLLSHPSHREKSGTLMNALSYYFLHQSHRPGKAAPRPILLHRLDRDTSGVIALAKNERANKIIAKAFRERRVKKLYLALAHGIINEDAGMIDAPIGRISEGWPRWGVLPDGDPSQTNFSVRQRFVHHSLLELEPLTGRTHQLRIHCAHLGHPIVGDTVYKGASQIVRPDIPGLKLKHQLLHAHSLILRHPGTGEDIQFIAPLSALMNEALALIGKSN